MKGQIRTEQERHESNDDRSKVEAKKKQQKITQGKDNAKEKKKDVRRRESKGTTKG